MRAQSSRASFITTHDHTLPPICCQVTEIVDMIVDTLCDASNPMQVDSIFKKDLGQNLLWDEHFWMSMSIFSTTSFKHGSMLIQTMQSANVKVRWPRDDLRRGS